MPPTMDLLLFAILPYVAVAIALVGTIERYRRHATTVTSHSSQFLENRQHFWGIVPFHLGLLVVLIAHLIGALLPSAVLRLGVHPLRLAIVESVLLAFGLLALTGAIVLVFRRGAVPRVRMITGWMDVVVYVVLLTQIAGGVATAILYPWGSGWYAAVGAPYLWSLARLSPDIAAIAATPLLVKLHVTGAWTLVAIFPFGRLVHVVAVPNQYFWRRPQVVRWYRRRPMPVGR
jgi:nitrate reductase gamma subunit